MQYRAFIVFIFALPLMAMERVTLMLGDTTLEVEVARTASQRATGLMFRPVLQEGQGMLFVFDEEAHHCMWMRNTYIPLSVAFFDKNASLINIEKMPPLSENRYCALTQARYALEVPQGWFEKQGITFGDIMKLPFITP